ncbi:MAG TPA: hypothetical protein VMU64_06985 [Acidimicrobiales bacterium]|nr:hypothetical protein [Acidimicrobiales bacterium]
MGPLDLLHRAQEAGLRLAVHGDRIVVTGPESAAALVEELKAHKPELLALLASTPTACARCGTTDERLVGTYWTGWTEGLCVLCVVLVAAEHDENGTWPGVPWEGP